MLAGLGILAFGYAQLLYSGVLVLAYTAALFQHSTAPNNSSRRSVAVKQSVAADAPATAQAASSEQKGELMRVYICTAWLHRLQFSSGSLHADQESIYYIIRLCCSFTRYSVTPFDCIVVSRR